MAEKGGVGGVSKPIEIDVVKWIGIFIIGLILLIAVVLFAVHHIEKNVKQQEDTKQIVLQTDDVPAKRVGQTGSVSFGIVDISDPNNFKEGGK
ncbi:hypothetical protein ACFLY5_00850 [Patescibacteria group bacterium]